MAGQSRGLRKVRSGEAIASIGARGFNQIVDAVQDVDRLQSQLGYRATLPADVFLTFNNSGSDVSRFGVLGFQCSAFKIGDLEGDAHLRRIAFDGVTPTKNGFFGVATEPIPDGRVGKVRIAGAVRTKVDFGAFGPLPRAHPIAGDFAKLQASTSGGAFILASDGASGVVDAVVHLGPRATTRVEARIHTPTKAGDNRWAYSATIGARGEDGVWADGAVTVMAKNRREEFNDDTGAQSSGVDLANLTGTNFAHVPPGELIEAIEGPYDVGGDPFFFFSSAVQTDGECGS